MQLNEKAMHLDELGRHVVSLMVNAFNGSPVADRKQAVTTVVQQWEGRLTTAMYAVCGGMTSPNGHSMTEDECRKMAVQTVLDAFANCPTVDNGSKTVP